MDAFQRNGRVQEERGDGMRFVIFTRPNDRTKVYVNPNQICAVYQRYDKKNLTIIQFSGEGENYVEVLESTEAAMNIICGNGVTE